MDDATISEAGRPPFTLRRWLLAGLGVALVGIGAVGVVVPGLPTTVFLIAASWCFARSCPWLEERLIRAPLFRPFQQYLRPGTRMPQRAVVTTLAVMWLAVGSSAALLATGADRRPLAAAAVILAGGIGSWFIWRLRERAAAPQHRSQPVSEPPRRTSTEPASTSVAATASPVASAPDQPGVG